MAKQQRDPAKEAYWRKVLGRFTASGLSVREFCKREQLTESAFYAWRRTIGEREEVGGSQPAFVPAGRVALASPVFGAASIQPNSRSSHVSSGKNGIEGRFRGCD
ncbi:MAG: hypothetical protein RJP95_02160 [Pirellulales bacterium]